MAKRRIIFLICLTISSVFILPLFFSQEKIKKLDLSVETHKPEAGKPQGLDFINKQYEEDEDMAKKLYRIDSALAGLENIKNISHQQDFNSKLQKLRRILRQDSETNAIKLIKEWISQDNTGLFEPVFRLILGGVYHYLTYEYEKAAEIYLDLDRKKIKNKLDPALKKKNKYIN